MTKEFKIGDEVWVKAIVTGEDTIDFGNGWAVVNPHKTEVIKLPPTPVLPKAVAEWLDKHKNGNDLFRIVTIAKNYVNGISDFFVGNKEITSWIAYNPYEFARAWLDGYEVEQEKRYVVKLKPNNQCLIHYMEKGVEKAKFSITRREEVFTKPELEQAGFGWIWDCEGVEVKEVEE